MSIADRGFASMDRTKQKAIATMGGLAAHRKGTAHKWNTEEAKLAGRKGAIARRLQRLALVTAASESASMEPQVP